MPMYNTTCTYVCTSIYLYTCILGVARPSEFEVSRAKLGRAYINAVSVIAIAIAIEEDTVSRRDRVRARAGGPPPPPPTRVHQTTRGQSVSQSDVCYPIRAYSEDGISAATAVAVAVASDTHRRYSVEEASSVGR